MIFIYIIYPCSIPSCIFTFNLVHFSFTVSCSTDLLEMNSLIFLSVRCLYFAFIFESSFYDQLLFFSALNKLLSSGFFFFNLLNNCLSSCCFFVTDVFLSLLWLLQRFFLLYSFLSSIIPVIWYWMCSLSNMSLIPLLYFQTLLLIFVLHCS